MPSGGAEGFVVESLPPPNCSATINPTAASTASRTTCFARERLLGPRLAVPRAPALGRTVTARGDPAGLAPAVLRAAAVEPFARSASRAPR